MDASVAAEKLGEVAVAERVGERARFAPDRAAVALRGRPGVRRARARDGLEATASPRRRTRRRTCFEAGGKRVRPLCVLLSAACFGRDDAGARDLAVVAELVHLATLLHDDVIDDADTRRGAIVARRVWGNAVSVLAGDLLLTHALERTAAAAPGPTMTELIATLRRLVDGEVDPAPRAHARGSCRSPCTSQSCEGRRHRSSRGPRARARERAARPIGADRRARRFRSRRRRRVPARRRRARLRAATRRRRARRSSAICAKGKVTLPLIAAIDETSGPLARARGRPRGRRRRGAASSFAAVAACRGADLARARAAIHTKNALAALATLPSSRARDLLVALATELTSRAW